MKCTSHSSLWKKQHLFTLLTVWSNTTHHNSCKLLTFWISTVYHISCRFWINTCSSRLIKELNKPTAAYTFRFIFAVGGGALIPPRCYHMPPYRGRHLIIIMHSLVVRCGNQAGFRVSRQKIRLHVRRTNLAPLLCLKCPADMVELLIWQLFCWSFKLKRPQGFCARG